MTSAELRDILDEVMRSVDEDPDATRRLRGAPPLRLEFPDLRLAMDIGPGGGGHLRWDFAQARRSGQAEPEGIRLSMDSDVANRFLQGRESPAIAIARGRLRATGKNPRALLRVFPAVKPLCSRYRELVASRYPHLAVEAD